MALTVDQKTAIAKEFKQYIERIMLTPGNVHAPITCTKADVVASITAMDNALLAAVVPGIRDSGNAAFKASTTNADRVRLVKMIAAQY